MVQHYASLKEIGVIPVRGCLLGCRHCFYGREHVVHSQDKMKFIDPNEISREFRAVMERRHLTPAGIRRICIAGDGNPLAHPNLDEVTAGIKELVGDHFKDGFMPRIVAYWSLDSVPDEDALIKRTRGLHELRISLDPYHIEALGNYWRREGILKPGATTEDARELVRERIRWAVKAAGKHGFQLSFALVGGEHERQRHQALAESAAPEYKEKMLFNHSPRMELDFSDRRIPDELKEGNVHVLESPFGSF